MKSINVCLENQAASQFTGLEDSAAKALECSWEAMLGSGKGWGLISVKDADCQDNGRVMGSPARTEDRQVKTALLLLQT